ncbi:MAG: CinA family nicotinamide mononucleotide deamidase-related protein [Anaerolineae bacterium]|nr:CinA family nicotinamide mononucleotide deamidase-related protein [Anaerolineae bacterium]
MVSDNVNAEIVAIGTEILLGEITDTNSVYIARKFRDVGINLYYMTSVGDNEQRIANALTLALSRADVVITCGGLGPTVDDITRQAVALATDRKLEFHQNLLDEIAARFEQFNAKMTDNNRRQAFLPAGAMTINNPVGTAPSFIVEVEKKAIISLPGVPREMKFLLNERIIPYLQEKYQLGIIKARTLKTAGIGESTLDDMLGHDLLNQSNPTIGLAAHHGVIDVRITAKASTEVEADELLAKTAQDVMEKAGQFIFGEGDVRLEEVLVNLLAKNNAHLAILEAGIDDAISGHIKSVANGHDVLVQSQQYTHPDDFRNSDNARLSMRELATERATALIADTNVDASIVILSLPDIEENADSDYATTVAIAVGDTIKSRVYGFGGKSDLARGWVAQWSMSYVWQQLKQHFSDNSDKEKIQ